MNKLIDTIREIQNDLILNEDRNEFLAKRVYERIKLCNLKYEKQFDNYLNLIESRELSSDNLARQGYSIRSLSKLAETSYDELLRLLSVYEEKFFK